MPSLSLHPVGGPWLVAAAAVCLFLLLAVVPVASKGPRRRRWTLVAIRLAIFALVLLAMLRPTLVYSTVKKQPTAIVVLADLSRSLQVADAFGGKTRWQAMQETLAAAAPALEKVGEEFDVQVIGFAADTTALEIKDGQVKLPAEATGRQTAIGSALQEVLRATGGKRLAAVLLLSDGAQRAVAPHDVPPQLPARQLAELGCPLVGFVFGEARGRSQARDVALTDLIVPQTVFVKNQLDVLGNARVDGFVNQSIPVEMSWETALGKMVKVGEANLQTTLDGQRLPIELAHVPESPGEYKLTLKVAPQPGELVTTNNELSTFVTVQPGGLRVLYLEGAPRFEQTHLRRSLDGSPDIQVDYEWIDPRNRQAWPVDQGDRFQPGKYDVYILGDLDSAAFRPQDLAKLAERVESGAGLLMLGGQQSFGGGGYQQTPLAAVLPLEIGPHERQALGEPPRPDLHWPGPLAMLPSEPLGRRHYIMHLAPTAENDAMWRQLPPLAGANRLEPRRSAKVLADAGADRPLLVVDDAGSGRVMAFAGDTTWLWPMHGFDAQHRRFWRQAILWLAKKDQAENGSVWIRLAQRRFAPTSRVEFEVGATTPTGDPVDQATFKATIVAPDGSRRPATLESRGDETGATFSATELAGDYTIEVEAAGPGGALGEAKARFLVFDQDLELDNAAADPTLVASLAKITESAGGRSAPPESLPEVLEELRKKRADFDVQVQERVTLWDTWPFFLALVALMCCEWWLRRRWGLV